MGRSGQRARIVLGLNSGTSADGVDAVACEISGRGFDMKVRVIGHEASSYPSSLRERLLAAMAPAQVRTEEICRLHMAVGTAFAHVARRAMDRLGLKRIDLVGSHGQTICHLPPGQTFGKSLRRSDSINDRVRKRIAGERRSGSRSRVKEPFASRQETGTLQIGDPTIIAAATGAPVVSDFRHSDMAVGGQGAPLVPWTDLVLFGDRRLNRVIQNIGGIANLTWLPAACRPADVIAFDCGPGNMIIDALVRYFSGGRRTLDRNGAMAARGKVLPAVLSDLLDHPFLGRKPPKSCGREEFGAAFTAALLKRHADVNARAEDWIATATWFTAECIVRAFGLGPATTDPLRASVGRRVANPIVRKSGARSAAAKPAVRIRRSAGRSVVPKIDEVIVCGGGALNSTLMSAIRDCARRMGFADGLRIRAMDEFGISTQAKEGVSFAMLAAACVDRVPANLPQVTGARRPVVLGQICDLRHSVTADADGSSLCRIGDIY